MNDIGTFTYLPLACDHDTKNHEELRDSWDGYGCSDILELFLEGEMQADETDDIGDGELEYWTERIAPVQMTLGWDARAYLVAVLKQVGFEQTYEIGRAGDNIGDGAILYYESLPSVEAFDEAAAMTLVGILHNPQDKERFVEVLRATLELAHANQRGLIFIWCWGYSYEVNGRLLDYPEVRVGLEKHGLKFFTRHA